MRRVPVSVRLAADATYDDDVDIYLLKFTHALLDGPIRLTTHATERLSVEPLEYGTRSTWLTTDGKPFLYVIADAFLPDDQEDVPKAASLAIDGISGDITDALIALAGEDFATVDLACVKLSDVNTPIEEELGMKLVAATIDGGQLLLNFGRESIETESFPVDSMTKQRFPGLHR